MYVEAVPVLFDAARSRPDGAPLDLRVVAALDDAFDERWHQGTWEGEYPLRGHMLIASLSIAEQLKRPLRARGLLS